MISQENSTEQFERFRKAGASIRHKLGLRAPKSSVLLIKEASGSPNGNGDSSNRVGNEAAEESEIEKTTLMILLGKETKAVVMVVVAMKEN